ncbi:MAG: 1-acyl-sn-glycerol-3-phosphate acyltransferase [Clostridia bacterium]|nr:1-acyl-sn-glycerol-3-phosphate acyltransferase [Clostridia bacterium]
MKLRTLGPGLKVLSNTFSLRGYNVELKKAKTREEEREIILRGTQDWSTKVLNTLKVDINVIGKENLPDEGPVVFISNHQSYIDIPCLLNANDKFQTGFIAKSMLKKVPVIGPWITRIGSLFIERGDAKSSLQTIKDGAELLKQGNSLVIFPEGTRAKDGVMKDFKAGSFKLAFKSGAPIIPVTIHDAYKRYEETGIVTPGTVDIVFHKAIPVKGLDRPSQNQVCKEVEKIIRGKLEELENGSRD